MRVNMGEAQLRAVPGAVPRQQSGKRPISCVPPSETVLCGVVSMGNPHCVIQVDDVDTAAVETLGPVMESHEAFSGARQYRLYAGWSAGLTYPSARLRARRGETQACGSGAHAPRWRWGSSGGCWRKRYAWNYPAVVLISPGKAGPAAVYDRPGGPCL